MKAASEYIREGQEFTVRRQWVATPPAVNFQTENVQIRIESISEDGENTQVSFSSDDIELVKSTVPADLVAAQIDSGTLYPT